MCFSDEGTVVAIVRDTICAGSKRQSTLTLCPSKPVAAIFCEIGADFNYQADAIKLLIQNRNMQSVSTD